MNHFHVITKADVGPDCSPATQHYFVIADTEARAIELVDLDIPKGTDSHHPLPAVQFTVKRAKPCLAGEQNPNESVFYIS